MRLHARSSERTARTPHNDRDKTVQSISGVLVGEVDMSLSFTPLRQRTAVHRISQMSSGLTDDNDAKDVTASAANQLYVG